MVFDQHYLITMKNSLFIIVFVIVLFMTNISTAASLTSLDDLQWKNRIIILFENSAKTNLQTFDQNIKEINERDIVWLVIRHDQLLTNYPDAYSASALLQSIKHRLDPTIDKVFLIGKDGEIKSRSDKLDLNYIFAFTDSMPMRQNEINRSTQ